MNNFIVNFGIPLSYIALLIATLAAVIFPLIFMFQDLKKAKWALVGVGLLVVIFLIAYAFSSGVVYPKHGVSENVSRMVEASLYSFYILLSITIVAILYSSISRYFK